MSDTLTLWIGSERPQWRSWYYVKWYTGLWQMRWYTKSSSSSSLYTMLQPRYHEMFTYYVYITYKRNSQRNIGEWCKCVQMSINLSICNYALIDKVNMTVRTHLCSHYLSTLHVLHTLSLHVCRRRRFGRSIEAMPNCSNRPISDFPVISRMLSEPQLAEPITAVNNAWSRG